MVASAIFVSHASQSEARLTDADRGKNTTPSDSITAWNARNPKGTIVRVTLKRIAIVTTVCSAAFVGKVIRAWCNGLQRPVPIVCITHVGPPNFSTLRKLHLMELVELRTPLLFAVADGGRLFEHESKLLHMIQSVLDHRMRAPNG